MRRIEYFPVFFRRGKLTARRAVVTALTTSLAPAPASTPALAFGCDFSDFATFGRCGIILILLLDATSCEKLSYLHRLLLSSSLDSHAPFPGS